MRVLMVASEVYPYSKVGGLADVMGSLPVALAGHGFDVTVLSPYYKQTTVGPKKKRGEALRLPLGHGVVDATAYRQNKGGVDWVLLDAPGLYDRPYVYGDSKGGPNDEAMRFGALAFAAAEGLREGLFEADVVHVHDWHTALLPYLLRRHPAYREIDSLRQIRTLLTIHNLGYQGVFPRETLQDLGLPVEDFNTEVLEFYGKVNILKAGVVFADAVNVVSPQYATEVQDPHFGFGLDGLMRKYSNKLSGILDGIDAGVWDPKKDKALKKKLSGPVDRWKAGAKKSLQEEFGMDPDPAVPLAGIVSRLTPQKGIDVLVESADRIGELGMQAVVLGKGDEVLESALSEAGGRLKGRFGVRIGFDEGLARRIYAGSDLFALPSRYEPCGLTQMIAMRYGAVPVAHRVGGLIDTIDDGGTGFLFSPLTGASLVESLGRAREAWIDGRIGVMRQACMEKDVSWTRSAAAYGKLLRSLAAPSGSQDAG